MTSPGSGSGPGCASWARKRARTIAYPDTVSGRRFRASMWSWNRSRAAGQVSGCDRRFDFDFLDGRFMDAVSSWPGTARQVVGLVLTRGPGPGRSRPRSGRVKARPGRHLGRSKGWQRPGNRWQSPAQLTALPGSPPGNGVAIAGNRRALSAQAGRVDELGSGPRQRPLEQAIRGRRPLVRERAELLGEELL